jgi:hypothetical protein
MFLVNNKPRFIPHHAKIKKRKKPNSNAKGDEGAGPSSTACLHVAIAIMPS